jgi:hypothetical protein
VNPSPSPVDVFVHSDVEWWQVLAALGPLAVLLGAVLAAVIGWNTLQQRTAADTRALAQKSEADNRTQWALDSSLSENPRRAELGLGITAILAESELASAEELEIISVAWEDPLEVAKETLLPTSKDRGVQVAAARLRLVTDRRLGKETPDWVKALAAEKPNRTAS